MAPPAPEPAPQERAPIAPPAAVALAPPAPEPAPTSAPPAPEPPAPEPPRVEPRGGTEEVDRERDTQEFRAGRVRSVPQPPRSHRSPAVTVPPPLPPDAGSVPHPRTRRQHGAGARHRAVTGATVSPVQAPPTVVVEVAPPAPRTEHAHVSVGVRLDARVDQWVRDFDQLAPRLIERARTPPSTKHYEGAMKILSHASAVFLDEGAYEKVVPVLHVMKAQERIAAAWPKERRQVLADASRLILNERRVDVLLRAYPQADPIAREALFDILTAFGTRVVAGVTDLIIERGAEGGVRKELFAIVEGLGTAAGKPLVDAIQRYARRWNRVLPLIRLVGTIRYREAEPVIADFLKHPKPSVRADTILSLYTMLGRDATGYLIEALDDQHPEVRQRALALLAVAQCEEPRFHQQLHGLLASPTVDDRLQEGSVIGAVLALQDVGNIGFPGGSDAEAVLASLLRDSVGGGVLRIVKGARVTRSTGLVAALCETLGSIGGARARSVLGQASRSAAPVVRDSAILALDRLEKLPA